MYKIETHLHTKLVSSCGQLTPEEILEGYQKAGYHGIVVTDHLMPYTYQWLKVSDLTDEERWREFRKGYEALLRLADQYQIRVYLGAELRFQDEQFNDYLVYGCPEELLKNSQLIFGMDISQFHSVCQEAGGLVIQAHPYRGSCRPAEPCDIDGIEVFNSHPRHENNNELSAAFAEANPHLIRLSGSDCHRKMDIAGSGILTETLPDNEADLVSMIRNGQFRCIIPE